MLVELKKQKKKIFFLCVFIPVLFQLFLYLSLLTRYEGYLLLHQQEYRLSCWQLIFKEQTVFYFSETGHIVAALLVYELFAVELKDNAWLLVCSTAYKRNVLRNKYGLCMMFFFLFYLTDYILVYIIGRAVGVREPLDVLLFVGGFLIQFSAAAMMSAFYVMIVSITKRIMVVLPLSIGATVLNVVCYYAEPLKFHGWYPFTYVSHCFRASGNEMVNIVVVSAVLAGVFLVVGEQTIKQNYDIGY